MKGGEEDWACVIRREEFWLVTSSPPCTTFRDPKVVPKEEELGKDRVRKARSCCKQQADQGGMYLREHPKTSTGTCQRSRRC